MSIKECCSNIGGAGPARWCNQPAKFWYYHDYGTTYTICSFCAKHNYKCGIKIPFEIAEILNKKILPEADLSMYENISNSFEW